MLITELIIGVLLAIILAIYLSGLHPFIFQRYWSAINSLYSRNPQRLTGLSRFNTTVGGYNPFDYLVDVLGVLVLIGNSIMVGVIIVNNSGDGISVDEIVRGAFVQEGESLRAPDGLNGRS